jgi:ABC-type spermidine/putrescine transport system permease subunit I
LPYQSVTSDGLASAVAPFWTSYTPRVYSWQVLLARKGVINSAFAYVGLDEVKSSFCTQTATRIGLIIIWHNPACHSVCCNQQRRRTN